MHSRRQMLSMGIGGFALVTLAPRRGMGAPLTTNEVFHDPDAPVLGNPDGDVTVVEFFDYQCPYCKKGHPDIKSVVAEDGNVRLIMKDWPIFGGASVLAAQLVLAANEIGAYEKAMETLMATPAGLNEGDIKKLLDAAGFDTGQLAEAVQRHNTRVSNLLTRNYNQAVAFNFRGTPSFVIGKAAASGVLGKDQLRQAIRSARAA